MSLIQGSRRLVVSLSLAAFVGPFAVAGDAFAQALASVGSAPPAQAGADAPGGTATPSMLAAAQIDTSVPSGVVTALQDALLHIMRNASQLGFQGRYDYLQPVVRETFDVTFMASKSVGRHWGQLGPEEQRQWLDKFTGYLCANYAGNFSGHAGENFELLGEQPADRDTRVVLTKLHVPKGEDVTLNYRLREESPGRWRIIDIYLKGTVSELALRRSDFSTTLKDKGFGELTVAVDRKIEDLRKKGGG
jgi:phospholipid transport system substrate-binding protein